MGIFDFIGNMIPTIKSVIGSIDFELNDLMSKFVITHDVENIYQGGIAGKVRDLNSVTEVVVHGTGGGSTPDALVSWVLGGERRADYEMGISLFHYTIGRDGKVIQILDPKYWCYHSSSGQHDAETIGIELLNPDSGNHGTYTDEQYKSLNTLIFKYLKPRMNGINHIVSHKFNYEKFSGGTKNCPGEGFDWNRIVLYASSKGKNAQYTGNGEINLV